MVRKLFTVALLALSFSSIAAVANAAPSTMNLSSWEPVVVDGSIVGGTRTVTITNFSTQAITGVTFALDVAPCDCSVVATTASDGRVTDSAWVIDELAPGATVTLTLEYADTLSAAAGVPGISQRALGSGISGVAVVIALVGVLLAGVRRLSNVTA